VSRLEFFIVNCLFIETEREEKMKDTGRCWLVGGVCVYGYQSFVGANKTVCRGCFRFNCYWSGENKEDFENLIKKEEDFSLISSFPSIVGVPQFQ